MPYNVVTPERRWKSRLSGFTRPTNIVILNDGTVTDREWALSLFKKRHRSSVYTQLPSSKDHADLIPKDLREGLSNFGLFVFPSGIKIGEIERKMQSIAQIDNNKCVGKEAAVEALMSKLTTPKQHSFAAALPEPIFRPDSDHLRLQPSLIY